MRRITAMVLAFVLTFALTACGDGGGGGNLFTPDPANNTTEANDQSGNSTADTAPSTLDSSATPSEPTGSNPTPDELTRVALERILQAVIFAANWAAVAEAPPRRPSEEAVLAELAPINLPSGMVFSLWFEGPLTRTVRLDSAGTGISIGDEVFLGGDIPQDPPDLTITIPSPPGLTVTIPSNSQSIQGNNLYNAGLESAAFVVMLAAREATIGNFSQSGPSEEMVLASLAIINELVGINEVADRNLPSGMVVSLWFDGPIAVTARLDNGGDGISISGVSVGRPIPQDSPGLVVTIP